MNVTENALFHEHDPVLCFVNNLPSGENYEELLGLYSVL
jgi:hypothetical protein